MSKFHRTVNDPEDFRKQIVNKVIILLKKKY